MTFNAFQEMNLLEIVDGDKLGSFLNKAQSTYDTKVAYHNDLHGADVM